MSDSRSFHLALAITGASGAFYAFHLLNKIRNQPNVSVSIILSKNGLEVWHNECGAFLPKAPHWQYREPHDFSAPFASGSNPADAMLILPCSMGTLGRIANGISDNLITRAADVQLKERRPLVLVPRESPYNLIHLRNMTLAAEAGAIIAPASPSFYHQPHDIASLIDPFIDRLLYLCHVTPEYEGYKWGD
jgi:4-hydroxy-3-polyprenylbenzoate decarboxylase